MKRIIKLTEQEFKNIIENSILKEQDNYSVFKDPKAHLLMKFLWENEPDEEFAMSEIILKSDYYGLSTYEVGKDREYLIGTDEKVQEYVEKNIKDDVWAFKPEFIIDHSSVLDYDDKDVIEMIQEKKSEDANDLFLRLIDNIDDFIDDAIQSDGRGHFMNSYDGKEHEFEGYYIYRTN